MMPKRPAVEGLPQDIRRWLDTQLSKGNFSGYQQLEAELKERGFHIGKSSIHRYGQQLESKLAAIKASTEAARAIAEAAPDDADLRSSAVISLVQTEVFDVLVQLQEAEAIEDPVERLRLMRGAAKSIAELSRASVNQKKWQTQVEARIREEEREKAAQTVEASAKAAGVSPETIAIIRRDILGMAG
jgi:hypothetical protein